MWLTDKLLREANDKPPGEIMVFDLPNGNPKHPEWTECLGVQDRATMVFLGFVGRLGYGDTWVYDDDSGRSKGKGKVKRGTDGVSGRDLAISKLYVATTS